MRVLTVVLGLAACSVFAFTSTAAFAQSVSIERVRQMAFDRGIVDLEEIEYKRRRNIWEVEGEDARGDDIEMHVDATTGRILKMKRD
ncbi:MAG: PepSY domain-containing protein [Methyloceanibacter sp.]|nr:PepSY domain-containing protein [Methyloceanibacter sp.]